MKSNDCSVDKAAAAPPQELIDGPVEGLQGEMLSIDLHTFPHKVHFQQPFVQAAD